MISSELLDILRCPESHQKLAWASPALRARVEAEIGRGVVRNRAGQLVIPGALEFLVREDQRVIYPVRDGLPILLIDEAIDSFSEARDQ